ncbi:MAG: chloride channel protein [Acidimicrobiales bacterium]
MRSLRGNSKGRFVRVLALSVLTGVITGLVVAVFEYVVSELLLHELEQMELWQLALAPGLGLALASLVMHYAAPGATTATSDEYVRCFHERNPRLPLRDFPGKMVAGAITIGMGGGVGLEGPAIYAGSTIGLSLQDRVRQFFRREETKLLLTAGAAAGVATVFKTPATGVIFALEAPYRDDVTRRALLPALVASAAGYVSYVFFIGTDPVVPFIGRTRFDDGGGALFEFNLADIGGALVLGIVAGLAARGFAWLVRRAKTVETVNLPLRVLLGGATLAALVLASDALFEQPLSLGPGYNAMQWVVTENGIGLIALLFGIRLSATVVTIAAGGVGGVFIPLATLGVILGQFMSEILDSEKPTLYPTLGLAAFLGAGYRAPLTAVMFVAESTGGGVFVVPALIAAAMSQLVTGPNSVSAFQRDERQGHLEARFTLPLSSALTTDVLTVPPDATVSEFMFMHVLGRREVVVPVVDGATYLGMVGLEDVAEIDRAEWDETAMQAVMRTELESALPSWTLRDAIATMDRSDVDQLAVTDGTGVFVGIVRFEDILKLDEILDQTGG